MNVNQIAYFTIEADINGKPFRLSLPWGVAWADAISGVEELLEKVKEIADTAKKLYEEAEAAKAASASSEVQVDDVSKE